MADAEDLRSDGMIQMLLQLAFAMPSLIVIRAAMGDNLAWYESLAAGIVAAMFSFVWIRSIEK